ncbi:GHKL domain-containing protein [Cohnella sp. CFH 77786]|uniref:ATP-binding protein n=1 Tax=Cohnella sp. CFH 77786 TaxID=2662265 RepID=UPI001C6086F3|nr:sensor histidine kinase [Cohnella sp. CFH 77786]MBW5444949.1 GHKL domain-containing protein [Cohnella sp. CFH 77786]
MPMRLVNLRMHWKITLLSFGIVLFSLLIGSLILLGILFRVQERETGQRLLVTARTVAELPSVRQAVVRPDGWREIQPIAQRIRVINDVTYLVILNMDRVRLSHPDADKIGTRLNSPDAEPAFAEHTYSARTRGEMGQAVRVYVPIMNEQHEQIGVVMAGWLLPTIRDIILGQRQYIAVTLSLSLLFGVCGSLMLARNIKRQMFDLEPHEIARILRERTAAFHAMHEGVIAIDSNEKVTIFNERAKEIFGLQGELVGQPIREVLPDTRLPEVLRLRQPIYNQEVVIGGTLIWSNRIPIKLGEQTVGAVAIFQDRTEITRIAEELTGVRAFVDALRVQSHEYMNKLHTIAGLLQLGQPDKALGYVFDVKEQQEELSGFLSSRIRDQNVSGLLLSKIRRGKELGIRVTLDSRSSLRRFPRHLDHHDLVLLLGNLIENAFDAVLNAGKPDKDVFVSIEESDGMLSILVEDNGAGMDEETRSRMLEPGYSTKAAEGRGIGLHLVRQAVDKGGGELLCESSPGGGTAFTLTFPLEEGIER